MGLMALEGRIVIEKALEANIDIIGIACSEESAMDWLAKTRGSFPIERVSHEELCSIVGFRFHHGAIALARKPALVRFDPGVAREENREGLDENGAYLCLWNVTDPSNVGALVRSAAGLGSRGVLLGPGCADPFYRKALRASMGNAFALPLYSCDAGTIASLGAAGFEAIAASLSPNAISLESCGPKRPFVLIVGNEGFGIPAEILALCGTEVYIPMAGGVDSLNVVVAAGICMYELFGTRRVSITHP